MLILRDNTLRIPSLIPKLSLHVGENLPSRHIGFPILKAIFQDEAFIQTDYLPPCFQIDHHTTLAN